MSTTLLDKRETRIRRMFGHIAPTYDLLNHLLSLYIDKYWRWRTTRLVPPDGTAPILDMCTGTGDLALAYDRADQGIREMVRVTQPGGRVAILEFSRPRNRLFGAIYRLYFRYVLPMIGQLLS